MKKLLLLILIPISILGNDQYKNRVIKYIESKNHDKLKQIVIQNKPYLRLFINKNHSVTFDDLDRLIGYCGVKEALEKYLVINDNNYLLLNVVMSGSLELVKYLIEEKKLDVNYINSNAILLNAAMSGSLELVKYLIEEHNLDVNYIDPNGATILFNAAFSGSLELVKYLIEEHNLDVNYIHPNEATILLSAALSGSLELVKYLIEEHNLDVNYIHPNEAIILLNAAMSGSLELVKYLIEEKKLDVNYIHPDRATILFNAAISGSLELVKYLIEEHNLDVNYIHSSGTTILSNAAMSGSLELVKYLIEEHNLDVNLLEKNSLEAAIMSNEFSKYLFDNICLFKNIPNFLFNLDKLTEVNIELERCKNESIKKEKMLSIIASDISIFINNKLLNVINKNSMKINYITAVFMYLKQDRYYKEFPKDIKNIIDLVFLYDQIRKGKFYNLHIMKQMFLESHKGYNAIKYMEWSQAIIKHLRKLTLNATMLRSKLSPELIGKINSYYEQ